MTSTTNKNYLDNALPNSGISYPYGAVTTTNFRSVSGPEIYTLQAKAPRGAGTTGKTSAPPATGSGCMDPISGQSRLLQSFQKRRQSDYAAYQNSCFSTMVYYSRKGGKRETVFGEAGSMVGSL